MSFFSLRRNKQKNNRKDSVAILPEHIGIIMDGNGRWAKKRGLPRSAGHTAGAKNFRTITRYCSDIGIKYLTVYAFSTENWKRPAEEVSALMKLFKQYLEEALTDFKDDSIVVRFIGDSTAFSPELQELIERTQRESADRTGMVLNIAMNYGSRDEIITATKAISKKVASGEISADDINEDIFSSHLYTAGQPDPDLIIRPSGEYRISNFMLWQAAYTEFIIRDILWPDFTTDDLDLALEEFAKRNRRFGGV
ncbi:MAG: isoprenyl transferase [Ruminococcus sp.]|nr:isoprenyl transferase [Ruminococcus sp.]